MCEKANTEKHFCSSVFAFKKNNTFLGQHLIEINKLIGDRINNCNGHQIHMCPFCEQRMKAIWIGILRDNVSYMEISTSFAKMVHM